MPLRGPGHRLTIGGVTFTGQSSIPLDGVNQTGTQDVAGNILSGNDTVCLNRSSTPANATFTGTSERAKIVRIHSRPNGTDNGDGQNTEHTITFVDGNEDIVGTTERSGDSTSFQNLEDHNMLTYNPVQQRLTVPKVSADILRSNGNVLVDISEGKFRGKADSASTAHQQIVQLQQILVLVMPLQHHEHMFKTLRWRATI